jgi:hypothetical protein
MQQRRMTTRFGIIAVTAGLLALTFGRAVRAQATLLDGITPDPTLLRWSEGVRKELKLSDDQIGKVLAITEECRKNRDKNKGVAGIRQVNQAAWTKLKEVLSDDQARRLKQLAVRRLGIIGFLDPEVHAALKLTDEQKSELRAICLKAIAERPKLRDFRLAHPDAPPELWNDAVEEVDERAMARMLEFLSQPQRTQWAEMLGPPYKFKLGE